jgi:hypothetical protein
MTRKRTISQVGILNVIPLSKQPSRPKAFASFSSVAMMNERQLQLGLLHEECCVSCTQSAAAAV